MPRFLDVQKPLLEEIVAEKIIIAGEMRDNNPTIHEMLHDLVETAPIEDVRHEEFREMCQSVDAIVRTGEATPYANMIIPAGMSFSI